MTFPDEYELADCQWALIIANKKMKCDGRDCPLYKCPDDILDEAARQITCGLAEIIIEQHKGRK